MLAVPQSQFTPLPEALCWVILELTSTGQAAVLPAILRALPRAFPAMTRPEASVVYDALAALSSERKVRQLDEAKFKMMPIIAEASINTTNTKPQNSIST